MKTVRKFKDSWFYSIVVVAVVLGELVAWFVSENFGLRNSPLVVGFLCVGLVAAMISVLYAGEDIG